GDPAVLDGAVVRGGNANGPSLHAMGGGLRVAGASVVLRHCTFVDNQSTSGGGAVRTDGGMLEIDDGFFQGNAGLIGGAMRNDSTVVSIANTTFIGNAPTSTTQGGAIRANGASFTATGCSFVGNKGALGGGLSLNPDNGFTATAAIVDCEFLENFATNAGGLFVGTGCAATIEGCTFAGNGALLTGGGASVIGAPSTVSSCVFEMNAATGGGGLMVGLFHPEPIATIAVVDCLFELNIADGNGGGIRCQAVAGAFNDLVVGRSEIRFNFALQSGGGLASESEAKCTVRSSALVGNWAPIGGGAVVNSGTTLLDLTTVFGNEADLGGGVRREGGTVEVANSIVWQNADASGAGAPAQLSTSTGGFAASDSCIAGWLPVLGGTNVIADDPRLADPLGPDGLAGTDDDDLSLLPDSPCINRAASALAPPRSELDLAGNLRRQACRVDMGALESPYPSMELVDCNGNGAADECEVFDGTAPDCNGNGIPDACDIANGTETDCNGNGVPDVCDVLDGTVPDCNGNGIPDSCDIASGFEPDCDGDGVPDSCQEDCDGDGVPDICAIAAGTALDCDGNGLVDACQLVPQLFTTSSPQYAPFGSGAPASFVIASTALPVGPLTLDFSAVADLNLGSENVTVTLDGVFVGPAFLSGASDCPAVPDTYTLVVPTETFLAAIADGSATLLMTPTSAVSLTQCEASFIAVTASYPSAPADDLNGDGVLDSCAAAGDVDGNGVVDGADIGIVLGAWGPCPTAFPCVGDVNLDGVVDGSDLGMVLAGWR
ncbi:MAG: hypothetical protein KDA22_04995, partial [Phycisphaerales bacterium]|nr:hypothetical protein [Phycisphaerales bacterium]